MNGEDIQLMPIPNAHTDGDTRVRFVQNDVIMTGDFFRSVQYPNIDRGNGGGLNGVINGLGQVIARSGPNTKIIPGHGPKVARTAVMAHRDMMLAVRDRFYKWVTDGKREAGIVVFLFGLYRHATPAARSRRLRGIFLVARPLLLAVMQGGELLVRNVSIQRASFLLLSIRKGHQFMKPKAKSKKTRRIKNQ